MSAFLQTRISSSGCASRASTPLLHLPHVFSRSFLASTFHFSFVPRPAMPLNLCGSQSSPAQLVALPAASHITLINSHKPSSARSQPLPPSAASALHCALANDALIALISLTNNDTALARVSLSDGSTGSLLWQRPCSNILAFECSSSGSVAALIRKKDSNSSGPLVALLCSPESSDASEIPLNRLSSNCTLAGGPNLCAASLPPSSTSVLFHSLELPIPKLIASLPLPRHLLTSNHITLSHAAIATPECALLAVAMHATDVQHCAEVVCTGGTVAIPHTTSNSSYGVSLSTSSCWNYSNLVLAATSSCSSAYDPQSQSDGHDAVIALLDPRFALLLSHQLIRVEGASDSGVDALALKNDVALLASSKASACTARFTDAMQHATVLSSVGRNPPTDSNSQGPHTIQCVYTLRYTHHSEAEHETQRQGEAYLTEEDSSAAPDGVHTQHKESLLQFAQLQQPVSELIDEHKLEQVADRARSGAITALGAYPGIVRELFRASDAAAAAHALEQLFVNAADIGFDAASDLLLHALKQHTAARRIGRILSSQRQSSAEKAIADNRLERAKQEAASAEGWLEHEHVLHLLVAAQPGVALPELRDALASLKPFEAERLLSYARKWLETLFGPGSKLEPTQHPPVPAVKSVITIASAALDVHIAGLASERRFACAERLRQKTTGARAVAEGASKVHGATWHLLSGRLLTSRSRAAPTSYSIQQFLL